MNIDCQQRDERERVRLRPDVEAIEPYRQGRPAAEHAFKLSSNENPYPPLPSVQKAFASASINRYPDSSALALREMLAARHHSTVGGVHVGAGSVSVLAQLVTAAAAPSDEVVFSWRSFEAYPLLLAACGATAVPVANTTDHRHDLPGMAAAVGERTRMVIVCSPNNPTSTVVTNDEFAVFMRSIPSTVLVVLDEAYAEFVTDPDAVRGTGLLDRHPDLVVLRTFSKAYGLAGLRIGYAIGPEYVMDAARAVSIPLSVTEPAQLAALASLEHEQELLDRVNHINGVRDRLYRALVEQGWELPRPQGNFLWLPTGELTSAAAEQFADRDVVVRPLGDGVRVSVGDPESVDLVLAAASEILAGMTKRERR